jgi:[acyl-carrier-protein] S-malonyltransferase
MLDWSKVAFVFPGQGSQVVGMGKDFFEQSDVARQTFEQADSIMGIALSKMMFEGPAEELDDTSHTQPAMYICSVAILRTLQEQLPEAQPAFVAGHSLGELTALTAAGALSFEEGVHLVQERGRLMGEAGEKSPGGMAAIIGLETAQVHDLCAQASQQTAEPVVLANDNCPGQIVISGHKLALNLALELAKEAGAKRAIPLAVSTAPHSPLMKPAETEFAEVVKKTSFAEPLIPVYANITAQPLHTAKEIADELEAQLTSPVHWTAIIQNMIHHGATHFVEIGSKNVLVGLIRRIDKSAERANIETVKDLEAFLQKQD